MTTKELIKCMKYCSTDENDCLGCERWEYDCGSSKCVDELMAQAASRLEELSAELEAERHRHDRYVDFELAEAAELAKVKAERDAAIADIKKSWLCAVCKKRSVGFEWAYCQHQKITENDDCSLTCDNFEWRGVMPDAD